MQISHGVYKAWCCVFAFNTAISTFLHACPLWKMFASLWRLATSLRKLYSRKLYNKKLYNIFHIPLWKVFTSLWRLAPSPRKNIFSIIFICLCEEYLTPFTFNHKLFIKLWGFNFILQINSIIFCRFLASTLYVTAEIFFLFAEVYVLGFYFIIAINL